MIRQADRQAHGPEQGRRTHHITTMSKPVESLKVERVEGQITMTKIQNSKPVYDLEERTFQFAKAEADRAHRKAIAVNVQMEKEITKKKSTG